LERPTGENGSKEVADMLLGGREALPAGKGRQSPRGLFSNHIGDFPLFWDRRLSEALSRLQSAPEQGTRAFDYCEQGKADFLTISQHL